MGNSTSTEDLVFSVGSDDKGTVVSPSQQRPRRIVKASMPSPSSSDPNLLATLEETKQGELDSSKNADDEMAGLSRNERLTTMEQRQRSKREMKLQEKRQQNPPSSSTGAKPEANPFSRFLSVFSVNSHPEHKRAFEGDAEIEEPLEKRPRPNDEECSESTKNGLGSSAKFWLSAVGVAAAAVVLAMHWKKR